ncbi:hypothetical protein GCM10023184_00060 [Flaviaesturariibacter amylovorans]|uniref:CdiI n=1 Tax=Flaviaesturariibacter amylovorans TaxID=1084520 RepID=A0ABP8G3R3_9BACT
MLTRFEYKLVGTGWARVYFSDGIVDSEFTVSYLSDPIRDLLCACISLLDGGVEEQEISFCDEPGETKLSLKPIASGELEIVLERCDDCIGLVPEPFGSFELIFTTKMPTVSFIQIVKGLCDRLLLENGKAGYKTKWCSHFPTRSFNSLMMRLNSITRDGG